MRRFFSPSWLLRHVLAIFLIGLFVRLGWWQLVKGQSDRGTLQNLFYGLEWPVFAAAVAFFWWRMVVEEIRPASGAKPDPVRAAPPLPTHPGTFRPLTDGSDDASGSSSDEDEDEDIELAAYNRYLAALHASDQRTPKR